MMDGVCVWLFLLGLLSVGGGLVNSEVAPGSPGAERVYVDQHILTLLHTALKEINEKLGKHEEKIDQLMTESRVGKVAFSASLLESGHGYTGPLETDSTLVFKHVISNTGEAYSPETGVFTAPVKGVYHFEFSVYDWNGSEPSGAALLKNGERVCMTYSHQGSGAGTSTKGVNLLLEAGDLMSVSLPKTWRIFDNENHHSLFSGFLLFPM